MMWIREIRVGYGVIGVHYLTGELVYVLSRWDGEKLGPLVDVRPQLLLATEKVLAELARAETGVGRV